MLVKMMFCVMCVQKTRLSLLVGSFNLAPSKTQSIDGYELKKAMFSYFRVLLVPTYDVRLWVVSYDLYIGSIRRRLASIYDDDIRVSTVVTS